MKYTLGKSNIILGNIVSELSKDNISREIEEQIKELVKDIMGSG